MSQLPPQADNEFQSLWKQHFNEELPREEAAARAHQTFVVLRMLIEPPPENAPDSQPD
jgi:hypothetical protein